MNRVELHCHLDGLIGPGMLNRLTARGLDYGIDPAMLAAQVPVRSMANWIDVYLPLVKVEYNPPERMIPILELHVEDLLRQHVVYTELMLAGLLQPGELDDAAVVDRYREFRHAADRAAGDQIQVRFLATINRWKFAAAEKFGDRIVALARAGLVSGLAIAGDENSCSIREWTRVIERARDAGLGIEIHAGEMAGPESVRDALEHGRPDRLGHAVRAFEDDSLVAELKEREVHIEFCPSSNLCLGVVPDITLHPIARARDLQMNYSINTDDPGPFDCTLESEHELLTRTLGFTEADFTVINANAFRARFCKSSR